MRMKVLSELTDPRVKQFLDDGKILPFIKSLKPEDNIYIRNYNVVALEESEHLNRPARVVLAALPNTMLTQDSCLDCVRKHIGRAIKKMEEVVDGHTTNSLRAQIELEEAEEEAKKEYPEFAEAIRQVRKSLFI
jgi:hypothetical protein